MKANHKSNKKTYKYLAGALALTIVGTSIATPTNRAVAAEEYEYTSIVGIEKIKEKLETDSENFDILEIVLEEEYGSIGHYIEGKLPFDVQEEISKVVTQEERLKLIDTLLVELKNSDYYDADDADESIITINSLPAGEAYVAYPWENSTGTDVALVEEDGAPRNETVSIKGEMVPVVAPVQGNFDATGENVLQSDVINYEDPFDNTQAKGTVHQVFGHLEAGEVVGSTEPVYYYRPTFVEVELPIENPDVEVGMALYTLNDRFIYEYAGTVGSTEDGAFDADEPHYKIDQLGAPNPVYSAPDPTGKDLAAGYIYAATANSNQELSFVSDVTGLANGQHSLAYFNYIISEYEFVAGGNGAYNFVADDTKEEITMRYNTVKVNNVYSAKNWFVNYVFNEKNVSFDINLNSKGANEITVNDVQNADLIVFSLGAYSLKPSFTASTSFDNSVIDELENAVTAQIPMVIDGEIASKSSAYGVRDVITAIEKKMGTKVPNDGIVNGAIYVTEKDEPLLTSEFTEDFDSDEYSSESDPYYQVYQTIKVENELRAISGSASELLPTNINMATSLREIVGFSGKLVENKKDELNILQIVPERTTATNAKLITSQQVHNWLGNPTTLEVANIKIETISMYEYIGRIDNTVQAYDMIYFSDYTGNLALSGGKTNYNDPKMDGLLYSNIGDTIQTYGQFAGMIGSDYSSSTHSTSGTFSKTDPTDSSKIVNQTGVTLYKLNSPTGSNYKVRESGNDINPKKAEELIAFANAGYPIVFADSLFDSTPGAKGLKSATVDNSSILYETFNGASGIAARDNVMNVSSITLDPTILLSAVNLSKPELVFTQVPAPYSGTDDLEKNLLGAGNLLEYKFTITNPTDPTPTTTNYVANLYLDLNADGKHDPVEEFVGDLKVTEANTGKTVNVDELKIDVEYSVTRTLPTVLEGVIAWKLEIVDVADADASDSEVGYSYKKPATPISLQILQVYAVGGGARVENLMKIESFRTEFTKLKSAYSISINGLTLDNYSTTTENTNTTLSSLNAMTSKDAVLAEFNKYNMILIGFAEGFGYGEKGGGMDPETAKALEEYIASGKSVLFAHDTTSFVNVPANTTSSGVSTTAYPVTGSVKSPAYWSWNVYFNIIMRDSLGLDRYGVTTQEFGIADQLPVFDYLKHGVTDAKNFVAEGYSGATQTDIDNVIAAGHSIAYEPGSNKTVLLEHTHGATDLSLRRFSYSSAAGATGVTSIEQVNKGQITTFPYNVNVAPGGTLTVASTHEQYYQVNMNDEDIVVWYTINTTRSPQKDVTNNYYIYSNGNVSYTGAGHTAASSFKTSEVQLFVNTLVASYRTTGTPPTARFVSESGNVTSDHFLPTEQVYDTSVNPPTVTTQVLSEVGSENRNVNFMIIDNNLDPSKKITVQLYIDSAEDPDFTDKSKIVNGFTIQKGGFNAGTTTSHDGGYAVQINNYHADDMFTVALPQDLVDQLSSSSSVNLYLRVITEVGGATLEDAAGFGKLTVHRIGLRELS